MPKVVHFEVPVDDIDRARAFYGEVFGWSAEGWGDEAYWLVMAGEAGERGVDGAFIDRGELHATPVVIIGVGSVDDTLEAASAAGAEVLMGKNEIPGIGYAAYIRDTEGNTIGVFQPAEGSA